MIFRASYFALAAVAIIATPATAITINAGETYEASYGFSAADIRLNSNEDLVSIDAGPIGEAVRFRSPSNLFDVGETVFLQILDGSRNVLGEGSFSNSVASTSLTAVSSDSPINPLIPYNGFLRLSALGGSFDVVDANFTARFDITVRFTDPFAFGLETQRPGIATTSFLDFSLVGDVDPGTPDTPVSPVPLPAGALLLPIGLGALGLLRRRRNRLLA